MSRTINSIFLLILIIISFQGCKNSENDPPVRGSIWTKFTRENSPGLIDNNIHAILPGSEDRIWFGTDSGAASYYHGTWSAIKDSLTFYYYDNMNNRYEKRIIKAIAEGQQGTLWFGTDGGGVRRYNRYNAIKAWQRYSMGDGIPSDFITGIAADKYRNGDVWITTTAGIAHYVPTSTLEGIWYTHSEYSQHFTSAIVRGVTINPANGWTFFATHDGVPYVYDDNGLRWGKFTIMDAYNSPVLSNAVDYSNTIWMGKMYGVSSWNPSTSEEHHYTNLNTANKLPNAWVNATTTDYYYKTRWFGTDSGLVRLQDTTWTLFNQANTPELPSNLIRALGYDKKGNLWIGTNNGIAAYNESGFLY